MPTFLRSHFGFWVLFLMLILGTTGCSEKSGSSTNDIIEQIASAQSGEIIVLPGVVIDGTVTVPPGVTLSGALGEEVVIEPGEGDAGVIMEGAGTSILKHIHIKNAWGAGVRVKGRAVTLENVEVQGTRELDAESGHGIVVEDAPSFLAVSVSSRDNDGSGLHIEGTGSVAVIEPVFSGVPEDLMESASRVIIHPQFMPEDEESVSIIHPQFNPSDDDGIAIIHPQFIPGEDDPVIIIHPQFLEGAQFTGNKGDGISVIEPVFLEGAEAGKADDITSVIEPVFLKGTEASQIVLAGIRAEGNEGTGLRIAGAGQSSLHYVVVSDNQEGVRLKDGQVDLKGAYISGNQESGLVLDKATLLAPAESSSSAWTGQSPDAISAIEPVFTPGEEISVIEPAFLTTEALSVIEPVFLPAFSVENNGGGGVMVESVQGESNEGVVQLDGAWIRGNGKFGVHVGCGSAQLTNSLVTFTQAGEGYLSGAGVVVHQGEACEGGAPIVEIDQGTLVAGNAGAGVVVREGAQAILDGGVILNQGPGIMAVGDNTRVKLIDEVCSASFEDSNCRPPLVSHNVGVGIAAGPGTELLLEGARISNTFPKVSGNLTLADLGDGVWADSNLELFIKNCKVTDNARAGVVVRSGLLESQVSVTNSQFANNMYGLVNVKPADLLLENYSPDEPPVMPGYWAEMEGTCQAEGTAHPFEFLGCLPMLELGCNPGQSEDCGLASPCGECTTNCTMDAPCTLQKCVCPAGAECCSDADCKWLDPDDTDCNVAVCNPDNTCGLKQGPEYCPDSEECQGDPNAPDDTCDGVDDNCDGQVDEGFVGEAVSCGAGVCSAEGITVCVAGELSTECTPLPSQGDDDNCDGLDNDCDGTVDNGGFQACLDGNPCTTDSCVDGQCVSESNIALCDDNNECTSEVCVQTGPGEHECLYNANPMGEDCDSLKDFTSQDLTGFDFSGQDLTGAIFAEALLDGANFEGAILNGADFTGAHLFETNMNGVDLSTATLTGVIMPKLLSCPGALPLNWWCEDGYLFGDGADYTGHDFENKTFSFVEAGFSFPLTNMKLNGASNVQIAAQDDSGGFSAASLEAKSSVNVQLLAYSTTLELNFANAQFANAQDLTLDLNLHEEGKAPPVKFTGADFTNAEGVQIETHGAGGDWTSATFDGVEFVRFKVGTVYTEPDKVTVMNGTSFVGAEFPSESPGKYKFNQVAMTDVSFVNASLASASESFVNYNFENVTFENVTFDGASMNNVGLIGMDLSGATFNTTDLTGANLTNANLEGITFQGTDLTQTVLTGSQFQGANLFNATLDSVVVPALSSCPAVLPEDWICWETHLFGNGVNYSNHDFEGMVFDAVASEVTQHIYLQGTNFNDARNATFITAPGKGLDAENMTAVNAFNLTFTRPLNEAQPPFFKFGGADFSGSDEICIEGSGNMSLLEAIFTNANNLTVNYFDANFVNAKYADFAGVYFTSFGGTLENTGAGETQLELKNANLTGSTIQLGTLPQGSGSVLGTDSNLAGFELADFQGADLTDATFLVPDGFVTNYFEGASFGGANLSNTDFSKMHFQDADLSGADLSNSIVDEADFTGANVTGVIWGICPNGNDSSESFNTCCGIPMNGAVPAAGCTNEDSFAGQDLTGEDFSGENLANADFTGATLNGTNFAGSNLTGATFISNNLNGTDFSGAILEGASFINCDLSSAILTGIKLPKLLAGSPCPMGLPINWRCKGGGTGSMYLWGEAVDYSDHDFEGASFANFNQNKSVVLTNVDLEGAQNLTLSASSTKGFKAENLKLRDSENVTLTAGEITNSSDFEGAEFEGAIDLTLKTYGPPDAVDPVPSHFKNADFKGVQNMTFETGTGGDWSGAKFDDAVFASFRTGIEWLYDTSQPLTQLQNVTFDEAVFPPDYQFFGVDLTSASFINAVLVTDASVPKGLTAGLVDVILTDVSFEGAFLSGTSFEDLDLTDVEFENSYLDGVDWTNATCPSGILSVDNGGTCCGQLNEANTLSGCN